MTHSPLYKLQAIHCRVDVVFFYYFISLFTVNYCNEKQQNTPTDAKRRKKVVYCMLDMPSSSKAIYYSLICVCACMIRRVSCQSVVCTIVILFSNFPSIKLNFFFLSFVLPLITIIVSYYEFWYKFNLNQRHLYCASDGNTNITTHNSHSRLKKVSKLSCMWTTSLFMFHTRCGSINHILKSYSNYID